MIAHSYATGHGDTVEDMLAELVVQVRDAALEEAAHMFEHGGNNHIAGAIRSLKSKVKGEKT